MLIRVRFGAEKVETKARVLSESTVRLETKDHAEGKTGKVYNAKRLKRLALFTKTNDSPKNKDSEIESLKEAETFLKSQIDSPRGFDLESGIDLAKSYNKIEKPEAAFELIKWLESTLISYYIKNSEEQKLATRLLRLVSWHKRYGKKEEATRLLDDAASCCKAYELKKSRVWKVGTLKDLAKEFQESGKLEEATKFYKEWETYSKWQLKDATCNEALRLAGTYIEMNKPEEAVRFLKDVASVVNQNNLKNKMSDDFGDKLLDCAGFYRSNGQIDIACQLLKAAEEAIKSYYTKNSREVELATQLMRLVDWYRRHGKTEDWSRLLNEAASCCRVNELSKSRVWKAETLRQIGEHYKESGKLEEALEFYKQWEIHSNWQRDDSFQTEVCDIADEYIEMQKPDEAIRLFKEFASISITDQSDRPDLVSGALFNFAQFYHKAGQVDRV